MRNTIRTELYLGTQMGWVDVSDHARQAAADSGGGTTITRVDGDAGTLDTVLASPDGLYSPRNPRSPYYGLLGRNTPIRVGLVEFVDDFDRTVATGWGPGWSHFGAGAPLNNSDASVSGGMARHSIPGANAYRVGYYSARQWRDCEVRVTVDMTATNITGGPVEPANILLRLQDLTTYYMARVEISASEVVSVSIRYSNGAVLAAPVTVPGLVFAGQPLRVAASIVADRIAVKVWDPAAGGEPRDWQATAVDLVRPPVAGYVGIRSGVAAGNTNSTPVAFAYDDLEVLDRRAHMEVSEWPPRWNVPGTDTWVPVRASGLLRRLTQGAKPLDSALYRYLPTVAPTAYWPLEDPAGAPSARSAVAGVADMRPFGYSRFTAPGTGTPVAAAGLPVFGSGSGIPGSAPVVDLAQGGVLTGVVPRGTGTGWHVQWVMVAPRDKPDSVVPIEWTTTEGTWNTWRLQLQSTGLIATFEVTGGAVAGSASATFNVFDGLPHHYAVEAGTTGGNMFADLRIDGQFVDSFSPFVAGAMVGAVPGDLTAVTINPLEIRQDEAESAAMPIVGHLAVWNPYPATVPAATEAMRGYAGETVAARVTRLCAEQGVPVFVTEGPDPSSAMGAQRAATFVDLLRECADTDGGILGEAREQLALTFRCLGALCNQTPVTVDYTRLVPPLSPTDDDALVRNDVTVRGADGGEARAVQETGPLSILPPPDGVGVYDTAPTVSVGSVDQLPDQAYWRRHLGTWDEARYPTARVDLGAPEWVADLDGTAEVTALAEGSVLDLDELPEWLPPGPSSQMVRGSVEALDEHTRVLDWTLLPAGPYTVAVVDGDPRVAADGTVLNTDVPNATWGSFEMVSTAANGPWTTDAANFPLLVRVGGEVMEVSLIGGTGLVQTAIVSARGVNGVARGWPAGTPVDVALPAILAL
ncbi:hypothetical protein ACGFI4_08455 [Micromonospora carbonacea]|uniref:hypothetical protein n=1 Tax=Micromonospora carbonacea TaxID=47853 RepID=UPI00372295FE